MIDLAFNLARTLEALEGFECLRPPGAPSGAARARGGASFAFSRACVAHDGPALGRQTAALPHRATYPGRRFLHRATASLVGIVESVCMRELQLHLPPDRAIVGVQTDIHHMGAAIAGVTLFVHGRAEPCGENETAFEISADDPHDRVATARLVLFTAPTAPLPRPSLKTASNRARLPAGRGCRFAAG